VRRGACALCITLSISPVFEFELRYHIGPEPFLELFLCDSCDRYGGEYVDVVIECRARETWAERESLDPLDRLEDAPCIAGGEPVFEKCANHIDGEACLRDPYFVPLARQLTQVMQSALEHIERVKHTNPEPWIGF
jgi:hypothetical protein